MAHHAFAIAFFALIPQDTTGVGALVGTVSNADASPAAFATICAVGTTRCALSDAQGTFRLDDLRAGEYRIEVAVPERAAIVTDPVEVRAGVDRTIEIALPSADRLIETVTVTAVAVTAPVEVKNSGFLVSSTAVDQSAGALEDVSRYIQTLPGVVIGGDDFRNDIIVRGGSPLENLFVVDNVEVPNINTFANFASAGGSASILDSLMLGEVTFLTGGYPASYINRASSVLQVTEREGAARASVASRPSASTAPARSWRVRSGTGRDPGSCRPAAASWICSRTTSASAACRCSTR